MSPIGLTALVFVSRIDKDPHYATTNGFIWFNLAGLLDFAAAITTAGLTSGAFPSLTADGLTSAAMDVWPLNLFPSFIVPAFIILHLMVLLQVRARRSIERTTVTTVAQAA